MSVDYPYPISGFWIFGQNPGRWGSILDEIHSFGANKVLQFGSAPVRQSEEDIKTIEPFKNCIIDASHGFDVVQNHIRQLNPRASIRYIYSFATGENFGDDLLDNDFDRKVVIGDDIFWLLVVLTSDPTAKIVPQMMDEYDFILVFGRKQDSVTELLTEASTRGMDVYVGMPSISHHPDIPWEVWPETKPIFFELLNRVLASYRCRHYSQKSFVGVYQSFELQISDPPLSSGLTLYKEQHSLVRIMLPRKKIVISPYWDARKPMEGGLEPEVVKASVKNGFKEIALVDVDIIAPQDSRGTGKVGLFWPYQENELVPKELYPALKDLHPAVAETTYGKAYYANTRDFYKVCREVVDNLPNDELFNSLFKGRRIDLWANVEAFEPGEGILQSVYDFQRTTKKRLDHALTFDGTHCCDQISFMWSGLYDCEPGLDKPLKEQIRDDWRRPIVVDAFGWESDKRKGVIIRGYGIVEGQIRLTYYDSNWQINSNTIPTSNGWINPDFGQRYNTEHQENRFHIRLQEVWIPFEWTDMAPDFWLHIEGINAFGEVSNHTFSVRY